MPGASGCLSGGSGVTCHHWRSTTGELPGSAGVEPAAKAGWSLATRSYPAFGVSRFDSYGTTDTYQIFRHPEGGRKDILRWAAQAESQSRNSKSIGLAENPADREPASPKSPPACSPRAGTNWKRLASSRAAQAWQLRYRRHALDLGGLGNGRAKPEAARQPLIEALRQDAGFHATLAV